MTALRKILQGRKIHFSWYDIRREIRSWKRIVDTRLKYFM